MIKNKKQSFKSQIEIECSASGVLDGALVYGVCQESQAMYRYPTEFPANAIVYILHRTKNQMIGNPRSYFWRERRSAGNYLLEFAITQVALAETRGGVHTPVNNPDTYASDENKLKLC